MQRGTTVLCPDALPPGTEIGHWSVVERLGLGGYGSVYRVEDIHHPGIFLALKLALRAGDARAERERVLLMDKAVHPNVVRFHGCGRWPHPVDGHTFHVMDWVPGPTLDVWAETLNPNFLQFAEAGAKMALALGELHARGVLHRDVKPENIIMRQTDGEPVLVDFGVGNYEGAATLTPAPLPPGTIHLRSPEAMRFWMERGRHPGEKYQASGADDLYALGVSLYRAVTGYYPFAPEVMGDLIGVAITLQRPHAPRDINRRVPRALSDALMRMLAKDPKERYGSGPQVHEALMAAAAFGGREQWEASLFEWEPVLADKEGEASRRRIRRPEWPTRPVTPLAPKVKLAPRVAASGRREGDRAEEAHAPPLDVRQGRGLEYPGRTLGVALGLALVLPGIWALTRHFSSPQSSTLPERAIPHPSADLRPTGDELARTPEFPDAGSAAAPLLQESTSAAAARVAARTTKGAPLNKPQQTTLDETSRQTRNPVGKALGTTTFCVGLACAGAQVRPADLDCPAESRAMMKALGLRWKNGPDVITDIQQGPPGPTKAETHAIVRSGPITSNTLNDYGQLPRGTLLFGQLFTEGTNVYGWYDRARTPDGKTYFVCFTLGNTDEDGVEKLPGSQPGAVHISRVIPLTAVKRFVFKEPRKEEEEE